MMFALINSVLVRPLPFPDANRLALVWGAEPKRDLNRAGVTLADFLDWRDRSHVFEKMAAWLPWSCDLTSGTGPPEELWAARVSANFFELLQVQPAIGRAFVPEEEEPGRDHVVIISYGLWARHFASDRALIGRAIRIDDASYTVIGVLPRGFSLWGGRQQYDLWMPLAYVRTQLVRENAIFTVFGRLNARRSIADANAEMNDIVRQLAAEYPKTDPDRRANVVLMHEDRIRQLRPALELLFAGASLLFLITLVNAANLFLSRSARRTKEMAVRSSLGATNTRLLRQLLIEGLLLTLLAGAVGLCLTLGAIRILPAALSAQGPLAEIPYGDHIEIGPAVLGFALGVAILSGVFLGAAPWWQIASTDVSAALKGGHCKAPAYPKGRSLVIISELSLSLILLVTAILLARSFLKLVNANPGFDPQNLLTARIRLPAYRYREGYELSSFFGQARDRLQAMPGVSDAAMISLLPLSGWTAYSEFEIEGRAPERPGEANSAQYRIADSHYFHTIGIRLLRGREFTEADSDQAEPVVVINAELARRCWPTENPIGKKIRLLFSRPTTGPWDARLQLSWMKVVGIVADATEWRYGENKIGIMYLSYLQNPSPLMTLLVRGSSDSKRLVPNIREAIHDLDPDQPVSAIKPMEEYVDDLSSRPRFSAYLVGLFALLATVLSATGIYAVVSYTVLQQTRDIGIRMALGAQRADVLQLIVGHTMRLALIGVTVGLTFGIVLLPRFIAGFLFGIGSHDFTALAAPVLFLLGIAFAACYIPALRATKIDPLRALRWE